MKKIILSLAVLLSMFGATNANAAMLNFDDITTDQWIETVPDGYGSYTGFGGFTWGNKANTPAYLNNVIIFDKVAPYGFTSIQYGAVSGNYAAVNNYGTPYLIKSATAGQTFTFNSAYFTTIDGAYSYPDEKDNVNSETVTVEGYLNGFLVASDNLTIFSNKATLFKGYDNFQNINELRLIGSEPTMFNSNFWMDNFSYNNEVETEVPAPEPASLILGAISLSSVLGFRKNRK